jgi:DnaJ-class molecular chaperone
MDQNWFDEFDRLQNQLLEHLASGPDRILLELLQASSFDPLGQGFRRTPRRPSGKTPLETCYRMLGLSPDASWGEIQHRYRQLSKRLHPDVAGPETAHLFAMVTMAYEQIRRSKSDPAK